MNALKNRALAGAPTGDPYAPRQLLTSELRQAGQAGQAGRPGAAVPPNSGKCESSCHVAIPFAATNVGWRKAAGAQPFGEFLAREKRRGS